MPTRTLAHATRAAALLTAFLLTAFLLAGSLRAALPSERASLSSQDATQDAWTLFRGDPAQSGRAAGALARELAPLWTFKAGGALSPPPALLPAALYFRSPHPLPSP